MSDKENDLIHELLTIVNSAAQDSTTTRIAMALLESRNELNRLSLNDISRMYYVSQPMLTRFIQKNGYDQYKRFKEAMHSSGEFLAQRYETTAFENIEAVRTSVDQDVFHVLEQIKEIPSAVFEQLAERIRSYRRVWFLGTEMNMSMLRLLQLKLVATGHNCYVLHQYSNQVDMLGHLQEDELAIAVVTNLRWIKVLPPNIFAQCRAHTVLLAPEGVDVETDRFDEVFRYGKPVRSELLYYELIYLIQVLTRMF